jgi:hypothetical protein
MGSTASRTHGLAGYHALGGREEVTRIDVILLDWNAAHAGRSSVPALVQAADDHLQDSSVVA